MAINFEQSLLLLDNVKLNVGSGSDLQIYHDSSNSYINDTGTGNLIIRGANNVEIEDSDGINMARFKKDNSVDLYYDGSLKFETTNTGVSVTGGVTTTSSSDMAGINMTSGLAMGNNNITGVNDITMAGTLTLNDELNMESGSDILMSATGNIQIDGDSGTGKFLKSVASGMEWTAITQNSGTVTSVAVSGGTGISVSGSPITSSGTITISADNNGTVTSIATTSPITGGTITGSGTIAFDSTAVTSLTNLNTTGTITDGVWNSDRKFDKTSTTDLSYQGDIVYWHSTTVTAGKVYVYQQDQWAAADADAESTSSGTLAIALGNGASNSVGMLIRGTYTLNYDPGTDGELLYIATTAGNLVTEPPSASGDVVRIVGQLLDTTNGQIFFNPDYTFITLS